MSEELKVRQAKEGAIYLIALLVAQLLLGCAVWSGLNPVAVLLCFIGVFYFLYRAIASNAFALVISLLPKCSSFATQISSGNGSILSSKATPAALCTQPLPSGERPKAVKARKKAAGKRTKVAGTVKKAAIMQQAWRRRGQSSRGLLRDISKKYRSRARVQTDSRPNCWSTSNAQSPPASSPSAEMAVWGGRSSRRSTSRPESTSRRCSCCCGRRA